MNKIQCKSQVSENISLAKTDEIIQNGVLSQKLTAVTPNRQKWLFYCLNHTHGLAIPPYTGVFCLSVMVWLILQNKPFGEYAKRLLLIPRVRPHRPFMGNLLKNLTGVFAMNTNTPANGNTTPNNGKITVSQHTDTAPQGASYPNVIPNNPKITLSQNTDNGIITAQNNGKITASPNITDTTHNPKTGLFEFDGKLFADLEAVRHYQDNTPQGAVKVLYTVHCKELGIFREFDDYPTAHTFATQLEQDYPQAHIEKAKVSLFFDDWDNGIITAQQGGRA